MGILDTIKKLLKIDTQKSHNIHPHTHPSQIHGHTRIGHYEGRNQYLIEIRIVDFKLKRRIKQFENEIYRKFGVGQQHFVPHISLVGGFETTNERRLIQTFHAICSQNPQMRFHIKGFNAFENPKRVIYLDITASEGLKQFRYNLAQQLESFCFLNKFDFHSKDDFVFHSTLSINVPDNRFDKIRDYVNHRQFNIDNQIVTRVTLLKNRIILKEYDFLQKKMFNRHEARDPKNYAITERLLRNIRGG